MKKFNVGNVSVTQTSEIGLTLDSLSTDGKDFLERSILEKTASELLSREEFKNFIVYYDGCCKYKIK